ncbi:MAG: hydrogenase maturation nickel metallochaperone HypA [Chloroflexi bacterium]|nr:hydrogenase maturation nickel metallochaperone HypA [Chloroflexota bacterium]
MHELAITQHVLDITLNHAEGRRVTDIYLVVGQLSSYVDDSVQFFWDFISKGTPAEAARLHFRREPALLGCHGCGGSAPLTKDFTCPNCGSEAVTIESGEEFYIEAIEIEMEEVST